MDAFCCPKQSFDFTYRYTPPDSDQETSVSEAIQLPLDCIGNRERAFLFMTKHRLPEHLFPDVLQKLETFTENRTDLIQCHKLTKHLEHRDKLVDKCRNFWLQVRHNNLESLSSEGRHSNRDNNFLHDENFYTMYHEVIHSGLLTPQLIQLENHNSEVIKDLLREKQEFLENLSFEHKQNIESILLTGAYSDREINAINKNNNLLTEKYRKEWKEKIATVRSDQKREFAAWIKNTYEDWVKDSGKQNYAQAVAMAKEAGSPLGKDDFANFLPPDEVQMEESYTINLGSQLKTTHNLRLISVDILKFCSNICTPQRLQTAMSLYSNSLSAIVLLVDKSLEINSHSGIKSSFANLCLAASENHFADFHKQLAQINSDVHRLKHGGGISAHEAQLNVGDVYISKHSNFSEAHLVFHVVTDDTLRSPEINSRHPVILGIRNILKIAYIYDIAHISIPLLLLHHMNEDITIQWCLRRAELILKCVKGFMIEMSSLLSLNDNENKTIQFVVPKDISQELFSSLSAIFPNVFRLSNPLFLTTSNV